jgi:hypothetical protein
MYISLMNSLSSGFRKWSDAHQPDHNDDEAGRGTVVAIAEPSIVDPTALPGQPHHPRLVPGTASSL